MRNSTAFSLIVMGIAASSAIWGQSWQSVAVIVGIAAVVYNGVSRKITFEECGLHPSTFNVIFTKGIHRTLFYLPILEVCAEVLWGRLVFNDYMNYSLKTLDDKLLFNNTASLLLCIAALAAAEEIPWRCHFQLHVGRTFPAGWALLLPAIGIGMMAWPGEISFMTLYFTAGIFIRRILWGLLYQQSGSIWVAILSHSFTTLIFIILVVGL
jgi:membrane protease YdiL (CAAX protease family)